MLADPFIVMSLWPGAMANGRWQLGIGDPTPMGWITTIAYALAGLICCYAAWATLRQPPHRLGRRAAVYWAVCGVLMLFLAVNKQLDLQTFFTDVARNWAKAGGWYETRRVVQTWFIRGLAAGGVAGLLLVAWLIRGARLTYYLALIGLVFTGCFVVIRAASFHHVDALIGYEIAGVRMNWVFELGGILVVAVSALAFRDRRVEGEAAPVDDEPIAPVDTPEAASDTTAPAGPDTESSAPDGVNEAEATEESPEPSELDSAEDKSETKEDAETKNVGGDDDWNDENDDDDDDDDGDDLPEIIVLDS